MAAATVLRIGTDSGLLADLVLMMMKTMNKEIKGTSESGALVMQWRRAWERRSSNAAIDPADRASLRRWVWKVACSHVQLCRGGETLEVLNAMIKHQTQVRIQPLARKKKSTKLPEAKTEQAFLGSWIPTTNHKIRLTDDLTWIFHCVTFLSLVWISPTDVLCSRKVPHPLCRYPPFSSFLFSFSSKPSPYSVPSAAQKPPPSVSFNRLKATHLRGPLKNSKK